MWLKSHLPPLFGLLTPLSLLLSPAMTALWLSWVKIPNRSMIWPKLGTGVLSGRPAATTAATGLAGPSEEVRCLEDPEPVEAEGATTTAGLAESTAALTGLLESGKSFGIYILK